MALYIVVTDLPFKRHLIRSVKAYSGLTLIEADCSVKSMTLGMHVLMSYSSVPDGDLGLAGRYRRNEK
jgi:hypothetical protein